GFAEVTITFDNTDPVMAQTLPLEYRSYSDIAVTRRLYRGDGSNDYFINKAPVRLRDVTELFLGTGVGRQAYSIVEQGRIGMIVSARPEDRRVLIEEAAGITKYKARKRQAENKMSLTRQNLTRVSDIVAEIERQLGSLKRQAAKAQRYIAYREELDDLVLWDASHKLLELTARSGVSRLALATAREQLQAERAAFDARDAELEVLRQQAKDAEQHAERAQNLAFLSDNDVREHDGQIQRASDRFNHLDNRLRQAQREQLELEDKSAQLDSERGELAEQLEQIGSEQSREQELVAQEQTRLEELRQAASTADAEINRLRRADADTASRIARAESEDRNLGQRREESLTRRSRLALELAKIDGERVGLRMRESELGGNTKSLTAQSQALAQARDALAEELPFVEGQVEHGAAQLETIRRELHQRKSRLEALRELAERMDGIGSGVRNLLASEDASLGGLVADRIEVPATFSAALGGLVGERLQSVLVTDADRAVELLASLAGKRGGRATVIPMDLARASVDGVAERVPSEALLAQPGVLGRMIDHVRCASEDAAVVRLVVGPALVVETAEVAQTLRRSGEATGFDLVTLDGTVFHADGRITGGAGDALATGLLDQKREIRELEDLVMGLTMQARTREDDLETRRQELAALRRGLDEAKARAHAAEIAMVTGQQSLERIQQRVELADRRYAEVEREVAQGEQALAEIEARRLEAGEALRIAQVDRAALVEALAEAERAGLSTREQLSAQQAAFTERKVQLASVSERMGACRSAIERVTRELEGLSRRIEGLEDERAEAAREAGRLAAEIFSEKALLIDAKRASRKAHAAFENARLGLDDARHGLGLREAELRELRATVDELGSATREHEMTLQRLMLEREHLDEAIRERFRGLELATVVGDYHARPQAGQEQLERLKELTRLIDRMGSVNLDAMKEYEESSERFTYYTEQRADLESALTDLEAAIAQMNKESKRLFRYAFDGVNRRFKEIFPKMFRGGRAELRLTNPDDMLETGIEILAQPPGKRVSNIELMSGGEKAFTAVSLLLALFRFKPSPFCILDEVDAPLDDANISRYVEAIRAMTDRSQFIVITHSKQTMQAVDVLYGVTMQEPGVSKLVGVRVGDRAARSTVKRSERPVETDVAKAEAAAPEDEVAEASGQVA
ncbi:MAG: chromosome segregation protein SMC, partial [Myxococcales bacterium]|nr:chromosome segregation protein SMC [Myxococcales bacterium]